ncbi:phenylacetate--CoA ligase family protein [Geomonas oryzae]|uniref:phenylacetate--CoA ligase family protein n=1 Tax=Geomonas oryzae TaxID=2364273 RepID=UPI0013A5E8ED|nr:AMP-binding protein [Geomonas oryzae]
MKDILLSQPFLTLADIISLQPISSYLRFYQECQWWPLEKLQDLQNNRLRELLHTACGGVPFYRDLYRSAGINASELRCVDDLKKLPIVTKSLLKRAYPSLCTRRTFWPSREYFTSGSSGAPFAARVDSLTMGEARALMLLRAQFSGWTLKDPCLQTGMSLQRGGVKRLKDLLLGVHYVTAYDLSDKNLDSYLNIIEQHGIQYVMGYPGSIYALADRAERVGFSLGMKGIVTWGDNLYHNYRQKIEGQFRCRVTDTYGCGEGIQVAAQCEMGAYHIFMPHVAVEIVDDDGVPVKRGESGNVLLTRLRPGAMPLIRYKIGDIGRLAVETKCGCGRGFDMLTAIHGRDSDFIFTPGGNKLIVHFFTGIFEYYQGIEYFRIIQTDPDKITVEFVPNDFFDDKILASLEAEIHTKGDPALRINFNKVDNIPLDKTGKRKIVLSNLINRS